MKKPEKCYLYDKEKKHSIGYCDDHYPEFVERVIKSVRDSAMDNWIKEALKNYEILLRRITNSRKGSMGAFQDSYCDISFNRQSIDNAYKSLIQHMENKE